MRRFVVDMEEHSQRHLEGSRLNQVGEGRGREERLPGNPETQRPRGRETDMAKMTVFSRNQRSWGREAQPWAGEFRVRGGVCLPGCVCNWYW